MQGVYTHMHHDLYKIKSYSHKAPNHNKSSVTSVYT